MWELSGNTYWGSDAPSSSFCWDFHLNRLRGGAGEGQAPFWSVEKVNLRCSHFIFSRPLSLHSPAPYSKMRLLPEGSHITPLVDLVPDKAGLEEVSIPADIYKTSSWRSYTTILLGHPYLSSKGTNRELVPPSTDLSTFMHKLPSLSEGDLTGLPSEAWRLKTLQGPAWGHTERAAGRWAAGEAPNVVDPKTKGQEPTWTREESSREGEDRLTDTDRLNTWHLL